MLAEGAMLLRGFVTGAEAGLHLRDSTADSRARSVSTHDDAGWAPYVEFSYSLGQTTAFQSRTLTITIPKRDWTHVQFDKTEREAHFQFAALMRGWRAVRRKF
jgi:hypothetical protein